jgi:hypothetical protein
MWLRKFAHSYPACSVEVITDISRDIMCWCHRCQLSHFCSRILFPQQSLVSIKVTRIILYNLISNFQTHSHVLPDTRAVCMLFETVTIGRGAHIFAGIQVLVCYIQGVYKRMVRVQIFIKRLHSATGRCSPPTPFSQDCTRATQSCSPTLLDRTCCKWRQLHTHTIWDEFDYRVDVCRVTQGAHIEGLWLMHKNVDSCHCWRCTFCPCKVRNKFLVNFLNRTILL